MGTLNTFIRKNIYLSFLSRSTLAKWVKMSEHFWEKVSKRMKKLFIPPIIKNHSPPTLGVILINIRLSLTVFFNVFCFKMSGQRPANESSPSGKKVEELLTTQAVT